MPRPVDTQRRLELAQRAVDVMRVEGIDVSTTRLAERLELKRPTFLYYFPDRVAIFERALERVLSEQSVFVLAKMAEKDHPIDQLYARICAVHEFHKGREEQMVFLTQALAASGAERTRDIVAVADRVFEIHRNALSARISKAIDDGIVKPCDPDALMRLCRAAIDGLLVQRVVGDADLGPVHQFIWAHLLEPLKQETNKAR